MTTRGVGVVLPVHNEGDLLESALDGLNLAIRSVAGCGIDVRVVIVLDACTDRSASVALKWRRHVGTERVHVVSIAARNVGIGRGVGARVVRSSMPGVPTSELWLATTDADSVVPTDWLSHQVSLHGHGVTVWAGSVRVSDWSGRDAALHRRWRSEYDQEHRPVHGTSLGITGTAYRSCGGFAPWTTGEDRALYRAAEATGATSHHCRCVPVSTSSRRDARAPRGFAHALTTLERG